MEDEENQPFWRDWSLEGFDPSWLFAIPIVGGGLWALSSLLFNRDEENSRQGAGGWLSIAAFIGIGYGIYHFFFRTQGGEEIEENIYEDLPHAKPGMDIAYRGSARRAYEQTFATAIDTYNRRASRSMDDADEWLRDQAQGAVSVLRRETVYAVEPERAAVSDAIVDVFMQQRAQQTRTENGREVG